MAWLKLDDGFAEHPKIDPLSARAFRLHVTALCLVARKLTDGHVTAKDAQVCRLLAGANKANVAELEQAGLWETVGDGWLIRDYLDYNPSAERVKAERERWAESKRKTRSPR